MASDILIWLDFYWYLMGTGCLRTDGGPAAKETVFGFVLSGSSGSPSELDSRVSHQLLIMTDAHESRLHQFWDLNAVGNAPNNDDVQFNPVLKILNHLFTFRMTGTRYSFRGKTSV